MTSALNSFALQLLRRFQGMDHADAKGNDGDILACPGDPCLADRNKKIVERGHIEFVPIKDFVFKENYRVRIADRALQEALWRRKPYRA